MNLENVRSCERDFISPGITESADNFFFINSSWPRQDHWNSGS